VRVTGLAVGLAAWAVGRREGLLYVGASLAPHVMAALLLLASIREVKRRPGLGGRRPEVMILVRMAADVRAGETIRSALANVAADVPALQAAARLATSGRPMDHVMAMAAGAFGAYGTLVSSAVRLASMAGAPLAPVVEELAAQLMRIDDIARERRAAMAPAILQAALVGGAPLVLATAWLVSGGLTDRIARSTPHAVVVIGGLGLVATGAVVVLRLTWKASR